MIYRWRLASATREVTLQQLRLSFWAVRIFRSQISRSSLSSSLLEKSLAVIAIAHPSLCFASSATSKRVLTSLILSQTESLLSTKPPLILLPLLFVHRTPFFPCDPAGDSSLAPIVIAPVLRPRLSFALAPLPSPSWLQ